MGILYWLRVVTASKEELDVLQLMRRTPRSSIETLGELVVRRITGVVQPLDDHRVVSPVSGRSVLGWGYQLYSMDVQARRYDVLPFALVADGHRARIDVGPACSESLDPTLEAAARFLIRPSKRERIWSLNVPPHRVGLLFNAGAQPSSSVTRYQLSEWVIEPGMKLSIVGAGVREPDPDPETSRLYRERPTWVMITGTPDTPIAITDAV